MAITYRYLADEADAAALQPAPLNSVTPAKLTIACGIAENEVDKYLGTKGIATPITLSGLDATQQGELKQCVAKMVAAVLFSQHDVRGAATKNKADAESMLDEFISHADLGHSAVQSSLGIVNAQVEYIIDWNDPNSTAENMDE